GVFPLRGRGEAAGGAEPILRRRVALREAERLQLGDPVEPGLSADVDERDAPPVADDVYQGRARRGGGEQHEDGERADRTRRHEGLPRPQYRTVACFGNENYFS